MPIDSKKLDALQAAIKNALNPPVPVAMTPEEFVKYVGEQVGKLAKDAPEIAQKRAVALDAAFVAMKTAAEAKLEKGDVLVFEEPTAPAPVAPPAVSPPTAAAPTPAAPVTPAAPAAPAAPAPDVTKGAGFVFPADMADPKAREAIQNFGK